jgi:hypothetical protein
MRVEFHRSAFKHGLDRDAILHGLEHALAVIALDPATDPPRILAIGPDCAGNLLEVVWLELDDGIEMVIHAMPLRPAFYALLSTQGEQP